jgi:hypothetical protein
MFAVCFPGTKQTLPEKNMGFIPWEFIEKPWDYLLLFFSAPTLDKLRYLYNHFVLLKFFFYG